MTLKLRIQEISEAGQRRAVTEIYQLLSDTIAAISIHTAIPVGELYDFVKDELK